MSFSLSCSLYKTNSLNIAVRPFSNRLQKTSKCSIQSSVTHSPAARVPLVCFSHVICDLLLNRRMATWNLFLKQTMKKCQSICKFNRKTTANIITHFNTKQLFSNSRQFLSVILLFCELACSSLFSLFWDSNEKIVKLYKKKN